MHEIAEHFWAMRTKTLCDIVLYMSDTTVIYCSLIVDKWGGAEGGRDNSDGTKGIGDVF